MLCLAPHVVCAPSCQTLPENGASGTWARHLKPCNQRQVLRTTFVSLSTALTHRDRAVTATGLVGVPGGQGKAASQVRHSRAHQCRAQP